VRIVAGHFHKPIALKEVGDLLKRLAEGLGDATAKVKPAWARKSHQEDDNAARAQ
jgi:hypothetical protein